MHLNFQKKIRKHNTGAYQTFYGTKYPFILEMVAVDNPIVSKTFDEIRNTLQSENIDKKIYNYQIGNTQYWSDRTKEKYEEFKRNTATLEILSIIERFKVLAKEKGNLTNDEVNNIFESLIDILNQTFAQNNSKLTRNNFVLTGGSNEKIKFIEYLKYKKYKEKYLTLKLKLR